MRIREFFLKNREIEKPVTWPAALVGSSFLARTHAREGSGVNGQMAAERPCTLIYGIASFEDTLKTSAGRIAKRI
jgi:hypothetical protein